MVLFFECFEDVGQLVVYLVGAGACGTAGGMR